MLKVRGCNDPVFDLVTMVCFLPEKKIIININMYIKMSCIIMIYMISQNVYRNICSTENNFYYKRKQRIEQAILVKG